MASLAPEQKLPSNVLYTDRLVSCVFSRIQPLELLDSSLVIKGLQ